MATEDTNEETTQPAPAKRPQITPSAPLKGLSTSLMQGAFAKLGDAFTATGDVRRDILTQEQRTAPFVQAGSRVAAAMENRWHQMEYENFHNQHVEGYIEARKGIIKANKELHSFLDNGQWPNPDGTMQDLGVNTPEGRERALRLRTQLYQDYYTKLADMDMTLANEAYKYPNNPLVSERIEKIITATKGMVDTLADPSKALQSEAQLQTMRLNERQMELSEREIAAKEGQLALAKEEMRRPKALDQALADPRIGPGGVPYWLTSGEGVQLFSGPTAERYLGAVDAMYEEQLLAQLKKEWELSGNDPKLFDPINDPEIQSKIQISKAKVGNQLQKAALGMYLQDNVSPEMAAEIKRLHPDLYTLSEEQTTAPTQPKEGLIGTTRRVKKQKEATFKQWQNTVIGKLDEILQDPNQPADVGQAMQAVVNWLPTALVGQSGDNILAEQLFIPGPTTAEEREKLIADLTEWLDKNWSKSVFARDIQQSKKQPFRGARRRRLIAPPKRQGLTE